MVLNNYWTECDEFKLIKDYVRPDDTLFDVGAQMGTYTIWMSKFITNGSIHSFEADPIQFLRLTENCQLNRLSHIKCNEMVLRDMEIESQFQSEVDEEEIPTKAEGLYTADAYCEKNEIDQVDYARVDMEGFEYFFLRGAMNLLQKKAIHIIQIEINGQVRHAGLSLDEVVAFIRATGYDLCRYDADGKRLYRCSYEEGIENYLLVADLHSANARIRENRKTSL
jgi:FkbM family methyltransferase